MSEWRTTKFSDEVTLNPRRVLSRGNVFKKVRMEDLEVGEKVIRNYLNIEYKGGGAKFKNGDTLLARITPSLENGKTSYVNCLDEDEIAFGSTEFLVLTPTNTTLLPEYLYYIARSPEFREVAIQSMTGSSGRQRVQNQDILDYVCSLPNDPNEQQAVTSVLSSLDDKIELNRKINEVLQEMGQTLFRHWFVDFEFPWDFEKNEFSWDGKLYKSSGGEMVESELGEIPKGWEVKEISSFMEFQSGYSFKSRDYIEDGVYKIITIKSVHNGHFSETGSDTIDEVPANVPAHCYINDGDILMSLTGNVGRVCLAYGENLLLNQRVAKLHSLERNAYTYFLFRSSFFLQKMGALAGGAAQENLSPIETARLKVSVPIQNIANAFEQSTQVLIKTLISNSRESQTLAQTRDLLLPRLMSGKLRVPIEK